MRTAVGVQDDQLLHCGAACALTRVRVYTPQTGGGQPVNPRTWSLRDFPESLAEGIYIPLCASGPQPRQFGGVCLTYEHRHHAFIHTLIHNVPDKRNEYSISEPTGEGTWIGVLN